MMSHTLAMHRFYPALFGSVGAVLVGIGIVYWLGEVDYLATWTLTLGLLLVGIGPLWWEYRRGSFDLFNLKNAFVGYYVVQFGVWTLWVLATGDMKFLGDLRAWDTSLQVALLAALVGLGSFFLGYHLRLGESLGRRLPAFSPHWNSVRLALLVTLLLLLGILSWYLLVRGWGGWRDFLSELGPARIEGIRGKGYFLLMAWFFPSLALLCLYAKAVEAKSAIYYALTGGVFLLQVGIGLSLGYRAYAFFPLLQLLGLQHYLGKRIQLRPHYLLVIFLFVAFLSVYMHYRDVPLQKLDTAQVVRDLKEPAFWEEVGVRFLRRFSGIETLALVIERFQTPEYGARSLSYLLTFPIPRALWPEKASPTQRFKQIVYREVREPEGSNTTLPGELYWNFHLPGLLGGMFVVGVYCRTLYSYLLAHTDKSTVLIYVVSLVYVIWMIEAPTTHTGGYLAMMSVLLGVLGLLTVGGRRTRVA